MTIDVRVATRVAGANDGEVNRCARRRHSVQFSRTENPEIIFATANQNIGADFALTLLALERLRNQNL
jgi:hypothetical protein